VLKLFRLPLGITVVAVAGAALVAGPSVALIVATLALLEVSLSFDNAVVNATVLRKMSEQWQRLFLTVGLLIAVFGMRLVLPLLIVSITARLSPLHVLDLAVHNPQVYANDLTAAHVPIAAFGGTFLLMIFLDFVLEDREITWLGAIERPLARVGKLDQLSVVTALAVLIVTASTFGRGEALHVMVAGCSGLALYLAVAGLSSLVDPEGALDAGASRRMLVGAGLITFLYLEVLDASFSFDGVIAAFAITDRIFVIAVGLGVGASYIRALTVHLVRRGTLSTYRHLEHGAHYAIGGLAVLLFVSISVHVPELVTSAVGVGFILASLATSIVLNRRERSALTREVVGEEA
jgi:hypothetical protein